MSLRYCLKCKTIRDDETVAWVNKEPICPGCVTPLTYFGREPALVSQKEVLSDYDANHDLDPMLYFTGESSIEEPPVLEKEVLACEDTLRHNPHDQKALLFLGNYYLSKSKFEKAKEKFIMILEGDPEAYEAHQRMGDIFLIEREFPLAIKAYETARDLQIDQEIDPDGKIEFHLGVAHNECGHFDKAIECLEEALDYTESDYTKEKIQILIDQCKE